MHIGSYDDEQESVKLTYSKKELTAKQMNIDLENHKKKMQEQESVY